MPLDQLLTHYLGVQAILAPPFLIAVAVTSAILVAAVSIAFLTYRARLHRVSSAVAAQETSISKLAAELEAQALLSRQMSLDLEEMRRLLKEQRETPSEPPVWVSPGVPVNLNRRGQILRLSRKGKSVAEIAQDLNVAQGEVELLLKLHDLSQRSLSQEIESVHS